MAPPRSPSLPATGARQRSKFEEFRREHEQLRRLTPDETKKIVAAVCEAEEDERQSVARDASQRVRDKIEDEYEDLEEIETDALEQLDAVLADSH